MQNVCKKLKICLTAIFLSGCGTPFPASHIYEIVRKDDKIISCARYPIISENPVKVGSGVALKIEDCPQAVFGFHYKETPSIMDWIRKLQRKKR